MAWLLTLPVTMVLSGTLFSITARSSMKEITSGERSGSGKVLASWSRDLPGFPHSDSSPACLLSIQQSVHQKSTRP
jgi:hypothetical protein